MDMVQTRDGKFVAVGNIKPCVTFAGYSWSKSFVFKFDINTLSLGSTWERQIDTVALYNYFTTINELPDGNLIVSGALDTTYFLNLGLKPMVRLIKLDKNGNTIWRKLYGRGALQENSRRPKSLNLTRDGGFIMANELLLANNPRPYTITKIDSTGCDSTEAYCRYVSPVITPTVISEYNFKIYPNPSSGILSIELDNISLENKEDIDIELTDMLGKRAYTINIPPQPLLQINLQGLTSGVYIFTVYNKELEIYKAKIVRIN